MSQFWKHRKVFITGHTGFKGSWLSLWLQSLGADLTGYALAPPTTPNLFTLTGVPNGMKHIVGDIRDFDFLKTSLQAAEPEIVIHMAAQPLVRYSYKEPIETYATNVMGTVHLLEAIRQTSSIKTVINVTTDKCYENKEWHWGYRENDRLGGYDPYSNSKACAELVTSAYRSSWFNSSTIGLASVRAGNVIGGGDWAEDRLIPDIIRACMRDESVLIRNPHALRPWQHVLEPLRGYLLLAEQLYHSPQHFAEGWNFGSREDDIKPVSWIADFITQQWSATSNWTLDKNAHAHEATYLSLDCAKAKSKLGWQPRWDLKKGLEETIHWYKAYQASENMRDVTLTQIQNYVEI